MRLRTLFLTTLSAGSLASTAGAQLLQSTPPVARELRVEGQRAPVVVDALQPRFSWLPTDPDRGAAQSAYRVLVASNPSLLAQDQGDLWDSGKVSSSRSFGVRFGATTLTGCQRAWWKVALWDETGTAGPWSDASEFLVGPIGPQWRGEFLWDAAPNPNDFCYFRRSLTLLHAPVVARIHVFAQDEYALFVNGTRVGEGPVPCDPTQTAYYDTYDIAPYLTRGENVIAARAHWVGERSGSRVFASPGFFAQAVLDPGTASELVVATDASWRVLGTTPYDETAPVRGPSYAKATTVESFDARLEPVGWTLPGFNDAGWAAPSTSRPGYRLTPRPVPARVRLAPLPAASVSEPVPGVQLVDFGLNRAGWVRLTLRGLPAGTQVKLWYSEEVTGGRIVRDRDGITNCWDAYTTRGDAVEVFEPDTGYMGMRYVEVEGLPAALDPADIEFQLVTSFADHAGHVRTTDPTVASLLAMSLRTQENTTQGVWIDGPQREQAQYVADAFIQLQNHAYLSRDAGQLAAFLLDLSQSDLAGGLGVLRDRYPTSSQKVIPEWTLYWVLSLWRTYELTEDLDLLQRHYGLTAALLSTLDAFRDPATNLLTNVPGAVYAWGNLDTSGAARTPMNCLYVGALDAAAKIATVLGRASDAQAHLAKRALVQAGIQAHLFDGVNRYRDSLGSTQFHPASTVLALSQGVTPSALEPAVLGYLEGLPAGPEAAPASFAFFDVLGRFERTGALFSYFGTQRGPWAAMMAGGATSTWESPVPDASRCHGWYAFPLEVFASTVVGIEPTSPGFATFRVRPHLAKLAEAEARVPTVRGDIGALWRRSKGFLELVLDVPLGTTARVDLPRTGLSRLRLRESGTVMIESDQLLTPVAGVTLVGSDDDFLSLDVLPGHYDFKLTGWLVTKNQVSGAQGGRKP